MAEIMYHFVFSKPKQLSKFFLSLFLSIAITGTLIIVALYILSGNNALLIVLPIGILTAFILSFSATLIEKKKGADIPEDEFILYDNGWFVIWCVEPNEGWIAPAKLDWILPPAKPKKELEKEIGYKPNGWYCLQDRYYLLKRKKKGLYKVGFGLVWTYPTEKWKDWVFSASAGGWLTEKEHKKLLEMVEYLNRKAKENVESGRIKIPAHNSEQEHVAYYQMPWYWNEVFKKENIRELYKKETGEDIPEPVRSFLFDYPKFKRVYLKNKRETGDWFGRKKGNESK